MPLPKDRSRPGQFADEHLLYQGRYHDWFYANLSEAAYSYVTRPHCSYCHNTVKQAGHHCPCRKRATTETVWLNREGLAWQLQAACNGADLDVFFPDNEVAYLRRDAPWREYCGCCPVTGTCKLYAADSKASDGIWAGEWHGKPSTNPTGSGKRGRPRKIPAEP